MNRQSKNNARRDVLGLFRRGSPEGCVKYTNETKEHFRVKSECLHWLKKNGYDVWTEPLIKKNNNRPDLLALHKNGDAYIIEILQTETESKFIHKEGSYPLPIIKIYTKSWDYDTFCI